MKFRDIVLLLVGGSLVVFGMILGDFIETDAHAQASANQAVKYEYRSVFHSSSMITERLNKYAEEGWILHETFKNEKLGSVEYVFHILKRVKQ